MISDVLEFYGLDQRISQLKGWQSIHCPFHDDNQASASVNLDVDGFKCHGCGVSGDALKLIQEQEGLPDRASAEQFAKEELGISDGDIPRRNSSGRTLPGITKHLPRSRPRIPSRGR